MAIEYLSQIPGIVRSRGATGKAQKPVCAVAVTTADVVGLGRKIAGSPADLHSVSPTDGWTTGKKEIRLHWQATLLGEATFSRYPGDEHIEVHVPVGSSLDKLFHSAGPLNVTVVLGVYGDVLREIRVRPV